MNKPLLTAAFAGAMALAAIPAFACDPVPGALIGGGIGAAIGNAPGAAVGALLGSAITGSAPCYAYGDRPYAEPRAYYDRGGDRGGYYERPRAYSERGYDAPREYVDRRYEERPQYQYADNSYYAPPPVRYYQPAPVYYAPPPSYYYGPALAAVAIGALTYPRWGYGRSHYRRWR
jgi:hypothetical protein